MSWRIRVMRDIPYVATDFVIIVVIIGMLADNASVLSAIVSWKNCQSWLLSLRHLDTAV